MNPNITINIDIEASPGNGEDSSFTFNTEESPFTVLAAFDGLGGRSAGFAGKTGGAIASQRAAEVTQKTLQSVAGRLDLDTLSQLQTSICLSLKADADENMPKSRLSGTLTGKRLCTTAVLASLEKKASANRPTSLNLAWIGDSRVYFLSPTKGLQQLTVDDLEINKDAFQMIREDPRMSQYLTADMPSDWSMHFVSAHVDEAGCILVCTDGCFQYLPAPWDFERLLLDKLLISKNPEHWESLLAGEYEQIKQDDVSLSLFAHGFNDFEELSQRFSSRLESLQSTFYGEQASCCSPGELWETYRQNYESRFPTEILEAAPVKYESIVSSNHSDASDSHREDSECISIGDSVSVRDAVEANISMLKRDTDDKLGIKGNLDTKEGKYVYDSGQFFNLTGIKLRKAEDELILLLDRSHTRQELLKTFEPFNLVLKTFPNHIESNFAVGDAYFHLREFESAIPYLENVVEVCEKKGLIGEYYQDALSNLEDSYYEIKRFDLSVKSFDALHRTYGTDELSDRSLIRHAYCLYEVGQYKRAKELCFKLLGKKQSENEYIQCLIGLIYLEQSETIEAKHWLEKSRKAYMDRLGWQPWKRSSETERRIKSIDSKLERVRAILERNAD